MIIDEQSLQRILERLSDVRIAVVGDLFLDKYLDLDTLLTEVSVETGLEAFQITRIRCYPGAGGTVLNNLYALGVGDLRTVSVIGDDGEGFELIRALRGIRVNTSGVVVSGERMTPTYTKPMLSQPAGPPRELNRLDVKNRSPQSSQLDIAVFEQLDRTIPDVHAVIIADQVTERNHGTITDAVRAHLADLAERHPKCLFFADSRRHIGLFRNCIAKPNQTELAAATGTPVAGDRANFENVRMQAAQLQNLTQRPVLVTLGPDGILYVDGSRQTHIPGIPVSGPIDIVGAGDSTMAGIVAAMCAGVPPAEAAILGCLVASITIQQLGVTGTAAPDQVRERFRTTA